jgi:hypothetical protein
MIYAHAYGPVYLRVAALINALVIKMYEAGEKLEA